MGANVKGATRGGGDGTVKVLPSCTLHLVVEAGQSFVVRVTDRWSRILERQTTETAVFRTTNERTHAAATVERLFTDRANMTPVLVLPVADVAAGRAAIRELVGA